MRKQTRKDKKITDSQDAGDQLLGTVSAQERHCMIAETAYLLAEQRGFQGDSALADWLQAETDINARRPEALTELK